MGMFDEEIAGLGDPQQPASPLVPPSPPQTNVPQPQPPMFAEEIGEVVSQENQATIHALRQAWSNEPVKYGRAKELAEQAGERISVFSLLDSPPALDNAEKQDKINKARVILEQNPAIKRWFMNRDNGMLLDYDELERYSGLPWLFKATAASFSAGNDQVELANLRFAQMTGDATPDMLARADALSNKPNRDFGINGFWQGVLPAVGKQTPQILATMFEGVKTGVQYGLYGAMGGATAALVAGQAGPQIATPEELVTVPAAAAYGFGTMFNVGSNFGRFKAMFQQEAGLAYDEFIKLKTEDGRLLDPEIAKAAAFFVGAANGGLEMFSFNKTFGDTGLIKNVRSYIGKDAVKAALMNPTIRGALLDYSKRIGKAITVETITEMMQEGVNIFMARAAKHDDVKQHGGKYEEVTATEMADRVLQAGKEALQVSILLGPLGQGSKFVQDIGAARRANSNITIFQALGDTAKADTLRKRMPQATKEVVEEMVAEGPVDSVYVKPERMTELFQSKGLDPRDLEAIIPGFTQNYEEAVATGNDVKVGLADYYTHIAGTPAGDFLLPHVKFAPQDMSITEAQEFNEAWKAAQEELFKASADRAAAQQKALGPAEQVFDDVRSKAVLAGISNDQARQYATLYAAFFRAMAERAGGDPLELYRKYGLEIKRELPQSIRGMKVDAVDLALDTLRTPTKRKELDRRIKKLRGQSLIQFIKSKGGIEEFGGELAHMGLPKSMILPARNTKQGELGGVQGRVFNKNAMAVLRESAAEAGYFPEYGTDSDAVSQTTVSDLLNAMREELAGRPRYSHHEFEAMDPNDRALLDLERTLDELGLDLNVMSNADIKLAIEAAMNENARDDGALYQTSNEAFDRWFGDSKVVNEDGSPRVVYHGSARVDRIVEKGKFDKKRATSGPMAFFTSDPELASSYSTKKSDTSLPDDNGYFEWFRFEKIKGYRKPVPITQAWWALSPEEKERISKLAPTITRDDTGKVYSEEGNTRGIGPYDYELKLAKGNHLQALVESWLTSGALFGDEEVFIEVLKAAGVTTPVKMFDPNATAAGVVPVYLSIQNPLDTKNVPASLIAKLKAATKGKRAISGLNNGSDMWDKRNRDPREWVADLETSLAKGEHPIGFTSIPDWVTDVLRKEGYDGIKDEGGHIMGDKYHDVWIPFDENQVKGVFNRGTFDPANPRVLYQSGAKVTKEQLYAFADDLSTRHGIKNLSLNLGPNKTINLDMIEVNPEERKRGNGTNAMNEIVKFADDNGMRVALSPGLKDDRHGTTSRGRLVKFYKRFGFVENKGRNKDFRTGYGMLRDPVLYQDRGDKRGSIQLGESRSVINLFRNADLSTMLHESGHLFLEVFRDVATAPGANPNLLEDWNKLTEHLGIWYDRDIPVEAHEKFARSFEAYLFAGKAPSVELQSIFSRFRSWLVWIYKKVTALGVDVPPNISAVLDRMLASDEDIAIAAEQSEFKMSFATAQEAGMTEAEFAEYQKTAEEAIQYAKNQYDNKILEDVKRETTRQWREERKRVRDEVTEEFNNNPYYGAAHYLKTGEFLDGSESPGLGHMKLSSSILVDRYGPEVLSRLKGMVAKDGVDPQDIASLFGLDAGHTLVERLMGLPNRVKAIAAETNVRMRDRHGDLMADQNRRASEVQKAMHNDIRGRLLWLELNALSKGGFLKGRKASRKIASAVAKKAIGEKRVMEALRVGHFVAAENKTARAVEAALLEKNYVDAATAKQKQLYAHYMALESKRAVDDVDAALATFSRYAGRAIPKGVDPEYAEQIKGILENYDLRRSTSQRAISNRKSLRAFVEEREAAGDIINIADPILDEAKTTSYKDLAVDDLRALHDTVKSLEHLGKLKNKIINKNRRIDQIRVEGELTTGIIGAISKEKKGASRNPSMLEKIFSGLDGLDAALIKIEAVVDWLDGGDINGPARKYLWQPIADAEVKKNDLMVEATASYMRIMERFDPKYLRERVEIPEINDTLTREGMIVVALNVGNASNRDKLMRGEKWNETQLQAILNRLSESDWQNVQAIWDHVNSYWPQIAALEKRLTGVEPVKVEAEAVETPFGELPGGYYPMVYDGDRSRKAEQNAAKIEEKLFPNTYVKPDTERGFTKERSKKAAYPVKLELSGYINHVSKVLHDLTHREAIRDVYKLITAEGVADAIEKSVGRKLLNAFTPWLRKIANDHETDRGITQANRFVGRMKTNATVMALGYRFTTVLAQLAGFTNSVEVIGHKNMAVGLREFFRNPMAANAFVMERSGEMRHRSNQMERDMRDAHRQAITGNKMKMKGQGWWASAAERTMKGDVRGILSGASGDAKRFAFYGIAMTDKMVSVPTWIGAYHDHLKKHIGDEDGAVMAGDRAVRQSQGAGGQKDLSAIQSGPVYAQLLTMFYSYFNAYYNRLRSLGRDTTTAIQQGKVEDFPWLLARAFYLSIAPALLGELLTGKAPGDDDKEGWLKWAIRKSLLYPFASVPLAREAAGYLDRGWGFQLSPAGRGLETGMDMLMQVGRHWQGEGNTRILLKKMAETSGYAFGLPVGQAITTVDNVWEALDKNDLRWQDFFFNRKIK